MHNHHQRHEVPRSTKREEDGNGKYPSSTRFYTREGLFHDLQHQIADKMDVSISAQHMTYGVLLREIEKLVAERHAVRGDADDLRSRLTERDTELTAVRRRLEDLESIIAAFKSDHAEKERELLFTHQQLESSQKESRQLRLELERAVKDADHNRQLLAAEVRQRASMLSSMHEEIRGDLQRTLFVKEQSASVMRSRADDGASNGAGNASEIDAVSVQQPRVDAGAATTRTALLSSQESPKAAPSASTTAPAAASPNSQFHRLEQQHLDMVASVRRQLACDVPRVVDVHNEGKRLEEWEGRNGSHHQQSPVAPWPHQKPGASVRGAGIPYASSPPPPWSVKASPHTNNQRHTQGESSSLRSSTDVPTSSFPPTYFRTMPPSAAASSTTTPGRSAAAERAMPLSPPVPWEARR